MELGNLAWLPLGILPGESPALAVRCEAAEFLRHLTGIGLVNLVAIDPAGGQHALRGSRAVWTFDTAAIASFIREHENHNIYYTANEVDPAFAGQKPRKTDIVGIRALYADLDPDKSKPRDTERQRIEALIDAVEPRPTTVVDSGNGYQLLWFLAEIHEGLEFRDRAEALGKRISVVLGGDAVQSVEHLLRLPGTTNYPTRTKLVAGYTVSEARIFRQEDQRYLLADLEGRWPVLPTYDGQETVPDDHLGALPTDIQDPVRTGAGLIERYEGDRSKALWAVLKELAKASFTSSKAILVLTNPANVLSEKPLENTDPSAWLTPQLEKARDAVASERRNEQAVDASGLLSGLERQSRATYSIIRTYRYANLVRDPRPRPPPLIEKLLRAGENLLIAGPPKSRKTFALRDFVTGLALGQDAMGFVIPRPVRVFWIQAEMSWHATRERAAQHSTVRRALELDDGALLNANLVVTDRLETFMFDADGVAMMIAQIRADFPDGLEVIALDALADVYDGESEQDPAQMMRFLRGRVGVLRAAFPGVAVIIVHHVAKMAHDQLSKDPHLAIRGASSLRGWYDAGIVMYPTPGQPNSSKMHFELRGEPPRDPINVVLDDGLLKQSGATLTKTDGGKSVGVNWDEVIRLLQLQVKVHGVAFTVLSFARDYGGTTDALGVSRDNLETTLNHEVAKSLAARVTLVENPLQAGQLGRSKRASLLVPAGCALGVDQKGLAPRYYFKGAE